MAPPRFFFSYARRDRDRYLDRFFSDLRREIAFREALDEDSDEAGFRDTQSIDTGKDWSGSLADALREAWSCVSLYTPRYFSREYCGKEFQVFLDRASVSYDEDGAVKDSRGIFPVLWAAIGDLKRKNLPPPVTSRINFNGYQHQARYEKDGLREILKKSPRGAYADILRHLVEDLLALTEDERPPPLSVRPSLKSVNNPFVVEPKIAQSSKQAHSIIGGPSQLALFSLIPGESAGVPASIDLQSVLHALEDEEIEVDAVSIDPCTAQPGNVIEMLAQANARNALTVVLATPSMCPNEQTQFLTGLLQHATGQPPSWCGAVLISSVPDTSSAEKLCTKLCASTKLSERIIVKTIAGDQPNFLSDLKRVMLMLRKRVVEDGPVQRNLPGGGIPTERPRIQGPNKGDHDE